LGRIAGRRVARELARRLEAAGAAVSVVDYLALLPSSSARCTARFRNGNCAACLPVANGCTPSSRSRDRATGWLVSFASSVTVSCQGAVHRGVYSVAISTYPWRHRHSGRTRSHSSHIVTAPLHRPEPDGMAGQRIAAVGPVHPTEHTGPDLQPRTHHPLGAVRRGCGRSAHRRADRRISASTPYRASDRRVSILLGVCASGIDDPRACLEQPLRSASARNGRLAPYARCRPDRTNRRTASRVIRYRTRRRCGPCPVHSVGATARWDGGWVHRLGRPHGRRGESPPGSHG
jgi:hypothetical protein